MVCPHGFSSVSNMVRSYLSGSWAGRVGGPCPTQQSENAGSCYAGASPVSFLPREIVTSSTFVDQPLWLTKRQLVCEDARIQFRETVCQPSFRKELFRHPKSFEKHVREPSRRPGSQPQEQDFAKFSQRTRVTTGMLEQAYAQNAHARRPPTLPGVFSPCSPPGWVALHFAHADHSSAQLARARQIVCEPQQAWLECRRGSGF